MTKAKLSSCCLEVAGGSGGRGVLLRKSTGILEGDLHGEIGTGMHSHLKEVGFTLLWWIQGAISATWDRQDNNKSALPMGF
jgi:hypothetical protein